MGGTRAYGGGYSLCFGRQIEQHKKQTKTFVHDKEEYGEDVGPDGLHRILRASTSKIMEKSKMNPL